jgi:hypothetical protein
MARPPILVLNLSETPFLYFSDFSNFRYNQDRLTRWDNDDESGGGGNSRRNLDFDRYALKFQPVTSDDSGTYLCLMNNRQVPDSPIVLTVQGNYYEKLL